jgi:hypothetical protein
VFQPTGDAIDFDANSETWTINAGVTVVAESGGLGVWSNGHSNTTLHNNGSIYDADPNFNAVELDDGNVTVINAVGASIFGQGAAIALFANGTQTVQNDGNIVTPSTGVFMSGAASISLVNNGYIFGQSNRAIWIDHASTGGTIVNGGEIRSADTAGIYIDNAANVVVQITNLPGGIIDSDSSAAIEAAGGMYQLNNQGSIFGNLTDTARLTDVIDNSGAITGEVNLDANSVLTNRGTINGDVIDRDPLGFLTIANSGHINGDVFLLNHSVFNGTGGTSGRIFLGGGNDSVTGGSGADRFVFRFPLGQFDVITNFTPKQHDKIALSETDFPNIGPHGELSLSDFDNGSAKHAHPEIVYTQSNGFLYYDSNGNHPGGLHHFATLSSHPTLTPAIVHASFIVFA